MEILVSYNLHWPYSRKPTLQRHQRIWTRIKRTFSQITVEPILFFYMFGIYLLFSVFHQVVYSKTCASFYNETDCQNLYAPENSDKLSDVQEHSSYWIRTSTMAMVVPSIVMDIYMGSWGDLFGRKVTLILPPIGALLQSVVYILMMLYPVLGVEFTALASFFMGIFGSFTTVLTGVLAYIGSITTPDERLVRIAIVQSMSLVAGTMGPFLGEVNTVVNDTEKRPVGLRTIFSLAHLKDSLMVCFVQRTREQRIRMVVFLVMAMIFMTNTAGELDIAFLYLKDNPFQWTLSMFSNWLASRFFLGSLALLVFIPVMKNRIKLSDSMICAFGTVCQSAAFVVFGLSFNTIMVWCVLIPGTFSSMGLTSVRAMISQCVEEKNLGKLFGLFAVFEDICLLIGSLVYNSVYPLTRSFFSGTMYVAAGASLLINLILLIALERRKMVVCPHQ